MTDPFVVLGIPPTSTLAEIKAARRRLALTAHPDVGGSAEKMTAINQAFAAAVQLLNVSVAGPAPTARETDAAPSHQNRGRWRGVQHDVPSFTVDALPVEAFEAILVVASWHGDVIDDDPPYRLDLMMNDPLPCWCRLDLVPDAGATTVTLHVAAVAAQPAPDIDDVRDLWVASLNRLGTE